MYDNIKRKKDYDKLLASGMFYEFYPELSGNWSTDELFIDANKCIMNANELRIGNWVNEYNGGKHVSLSSKDILDISQGKYPVSPIPLTPEVIEKYGIVKRYATKNPYYFIELDFTRIIELEFCLNGMINVYLVKKNKNEIAIIRVRTIEHLHQLQNLYFALTGEELNYTP